MTSSPLQTLTLLSLLSLGQCTKTDQGVQQRPLQSPSPSLLETLSMRLTAYEQNPDPHVKELLLGEPYLTIERFFPTTYVRDTDVVIPQHIFGFANRRLRHAQIRVDATSYPIHLVNGSHTAYFVTQEPLCFQQFPAGAHTLVLSASTEDNTPLVWEDCVFVLDKPSTTIFK